MALSEFVAMEAAYQALQRLDAGARQRALHWLTDALSVSDPLPRASVATTTEPEAEPEPEPEPSPRTRTRRSSASRTAETRASENGRARGGRRGRGASTVASGNGERAYRRMPEADTVLAAYEEVGSVSALAEYFGVPRHTVQGWARRLRREGYDIGRTA